MVTVSLICINTINKFYKLSTNQKYVKEKKIRGELQFGDFQFENLPKMYQFQEA